jgi:hypothetical protein
VHRGPLIDLDLANVQLTVHAWSTAGAAGLAVQIEDELGRVLAQGRTDGDGRFDAVFSTGLLDPGSGALVAVSSNDATRAGATRRLAITRSLASTITLSTHANAARRTLTLRGAAATTRGPLSHEAVGIEFDEKHVATTLSDHQGNFSVTVSTRAIPQGASASLIARAHLVPDVPWVRPARSAPVELAGVQDTTPHTAWLGASGLASLALATWLAFRTRVRAARPNTGTRAEAGLHLGAVARRTGAAVSFIAGRIADATTDRPLGAGTVALASLAGAHLNVPVSRAGTFRSDDLPAGVYTLSVGAPGYADVRARIAIPHLGEASTITIRLSDLRNLALSSHRKAVSAIANEDTGVHAWTPREGLRHALPKAGDPALLSEFTSLVETTAYAAPIPLASDLEAVDSRAATLLKRAHAQQHPTPTRRR